MEFKKKLLDKLVIGQFLPKVLGEVSTVEWDSKIESYDYYSLFYRSDIILYDEQYFQSESIVFYIEYMDCISLYKCYFNDESIIIYPPFFEDNFDYSVGLRISKIISSFFKEISLKKQFYNLPFTNNLMNHFKLQMEFMGSLKSSMEMYIDISFSAEDLWKSIRKSYKSIINYGIKNLVVESKFDEETWKKCKSLHLKVAGRKTRNDETWNLQKSMLEKKNAKIFYIKEDENILGFAFFVCSKSVINYSIAAYDRSKFNEVSISHIIIWRALEYFKANGFESIYMGEYAPIKHHNNNKLSNIDHFKLGFSNKLICNNYISNE